MEKATKEFAFMLPILSSHVPRKPCPALRRKGRVTAEVRSWEATACLDLATGRSAQMRGFATGVGSKADVGAPPEDDTTATHRHPWWAGKVGLADTTS